VGGFLPKATLYPGSVSALRVRPIETVPKMIDLVAQLKIRYGLKVAVVSNESRAVNEHRIRKFKLDRFVDTFVSSC